MGDVEHRAVPAAQMHDTGDGFGNRPIWYGDRPPIGTLLYASPPPPAQADDGKDAEIEHLKLEMDGVDNAKEEIGRLLGLTEEFRWKRISAAIHEQKRLIRELVAALKPFAEEEPEHEEISEDNELVAPRWLDATYGQYRAARAVLAKAKAVGFEP